MTGGMKRTQGGGFVMGLIVGLLGGLALALAVALYVTKVPIPFINKVPQRGGDRDAEERERNRNWDPNSPLYGSNPARSAAPGAVASGVVAPAEPVPADAEPRAAAATAPATIAPPAPAASAQRSSALGAAAGTAAAAGPPQRSSLPQPPPGTADANPRDPAAILSDRTPSADPADTSVSTKARDDPFMYFVQAGAYGRPEDAEQQRAKLAMIGIETRITEREQAGRTVYRVRVGPFDKRDQADATKQRLEAAAVEAALVRVQK